MTLTNKANWVLDHLASMPDVAHTTCQLATLQNLMLCTDGQLMARGKLYDIVSKRMCPGVYRVSLELKS